MQPEKRKKRSRILFLILIFLSLGLLFSNISENFSQKPAGRAILFAARPFLIASGFIRTVTEKTGAAYFFYDRLAADKRQLQKELAQIKLQLIESRKETNALRQAAHLMQTPQKNIIENYALLPADIISFNPNPWTRSVLINRGARHGVKPEQTVMNERGVAGVVKNVISDMALVSLAIDQRSAVTVRVQETGELGIVEGTGRPESLSLKIEGLSRHIRRNDHVVTAGLKESPYPGGLDIGVVETVDKDKFGRATISVKPSVDFMRLNTLFILLGSEQIRERGFEGD